MKKQRCDIGEWKPLEEQLLISLLHLHNHY